VILHEGVYILIITGVAVTVGSSETPDLPSTKRCRLMPSVQTPQVSNQNLLQLPTNPSSSLSLPSTPSDEAFGMVKTILKEKVKKISCQTLSEMILDETKNPPIILDCRPFIAHNINHIQGALNVNCSDRFNRKRLQQGKAILADLATTKDGKDLLKDRSWTEVIVYDDSTDDIESVPLNSSIYVVLRALVEDLREPVMLVGGHQHFHTLYTNLCQNHLMVVGSNEAKDNWFPDLPSPSDTHNSKDIENHPVSLAVNIEVQLPLKLKFFIHTCRKPIRISILFNTFDSLFYHATYSSPFSPQVHLITALLHRMLINRLAPKDVS